MKVKIEQDRILPEGEYELTNPEKLERAKNKLPLGSTNNQILIEYDKIAGRVTKNGIVLPAQSLWNIEKKHMDKPIEQYTDDELLSVIRRAENSSTPGSQYQRADNEWKIRQQKKLIEVTEMQANFSKKEWYEKPIGIIAIAVIISGIVFWLGWN